MSTETVALTEDETAVMLAAIRAEQDARAEAERMARVQDEAEAENAARDASERQAQIEALALARVQDEAEAENAERDALAASLAEFAAANAAAVPILLPALDVFDAPHGRFGPTFRAELVAAGVNSFHFSVSEARVIFGENITEEERTAVVSVIEAHDPTKPAPPPVTTVSKLTVFRRMTDDEADQVDAALSQASTRMRAIFNSAMNFRSDAEEWAVLYGIASGLFGADRANELLAPEDENGTTSPAAAAATG